MEVTLDKEKKGLFSRRKRNLLLIGLPVSFWLVLVVVIPVTLMFFMSFQSVEGYEIIKIITFKNYFEFFRKQVYWRLLLKSFRMAFTVSATAILICYPLAYFIARKINKYRRLLFMLIVTPLWVSYLVRIIAWRNILGNKGIINLLLIKLGIIEKPLEIFLYNQFAVIITLTYIAIPFVFIPLYTALEKIPNNLIDASKDLGASEMRIIAHIILPLSLPGLLTGFMLSFIIALGDYIIPRELGGTGGVMYGNIVWSQFGLIFDWPLGSALGFILFLIAAIVLSLSRKFGATEGVYF
jgi:spermidine/putrescine transport system permease protein